MSSFDDPFDSFTKYDGDVDIHMNKNLDVEM